MTETYLTATEIGKLAHLINSLGVIGGQLMVRHRPDHYQRAHTNLQNFRRDNKELLERIHTLARKVGDESALRLAEDLEHLPADAIQMLSLARRCLLASAFLGHCVANAEQPPVETSPEQLDRRLH